MSLNQIMFFYQKFFRKVKKVREVIREEKTEDTKEQK